MDTEIIKSSVYRLNSMVYELNSMVYELNKLEKTLEDAAAKAAIMANGHAKKGDALRNRTNYGAMVQALATLGLVGLEARHDSWEDAGMMKVQKVTVGDETIYEIEEGVNADD